MPEPGFRPEALGPRRVVSVSTARIDEQRMLSISSRGRQLTSNFVLPANIFWNPMPTPSMTASNTAHPMAPFLAARKPPRIARDPPVRNPAAMALKGSSFRLTPLTAQSKVLKRPPQTPKLPPSTGARILTAVMAPMRRSP